jgi:hypothetical protein
MPIVNGPATHHGHGVEPTKSPKTEYKRLNTVLRSVTNPVRREPTNTVLVAEEITVAV